MLLGLSPYRATPSPPFFSSRFNDGTAPAPRCRSRRVE
uniref:Uncharacterized protein n=1 Tax=Setaria viridis TaxID=4556 RepID=A0A4U6WD40_SETVI|nr:hypothetical protein SEVIR_2G394550v2 [Setaria viridis]